MTESGTWWTGELLGFDFETTGIDRFNDVPVSYALVTVVDGAVVHRRGSLVDPGREIPAEASAVHGITTERARGEGRPLPDAVVEVARALVDASRRGVPVVGMKLDYDLTILDVQCQWLLGQSLESMGWCGPVLDGLVLDRRFDKYRRGRRTLIDLCAHYEVTIEQAHEAAADAEAAVSVVLAMCARYPELAAASLYELHRNQSDWHREWAESYDRWRQAEALQPLDRRDLYWPIALEGAA